MRFSCISVSNNVSYGKGTASQIGKGDIQLIAKHLRTNWGNYIVEAIMYLT